MRLPEIVRAVFVCDEDKCDFAVGRVGVNARRKQMEVLGCVVVEGLVENFAEQFDSSASPHAVVY